MELTLEAIDNMSADEYRKNLQDSAFVEAATALMPAPAKVAPPSPEPGEPAAAVVPPVAAPPVAEVPPTPPVTELPEQTLEYQPVDEFNRPMGGKQVIKYRTEAEKTQKLIEQNTLILRQLRKVTREARLATPAEGIPAEAPRIKKIVEFKAENLSAEERFQLSQDLNDPEKFQSARDRLFKSATGATPEELNSSLNANQLATQQLIAMQNYEIFVRSNQGNFHPDVENCKTLTDWMVKNELQPTVENFELACSTLREAGLLLDAPVVQQVTPPAAIAVAPVVGANTQPPVAAETRISSEPQPQVKRQSQVPSGLNDRNSSISGPQVPVDGLSLTLADIDRMSGDEYKVRIRDPKFAAAVNRLQAEADQRRKQRLAQV